MTGVLTILSTKILDSEARAYTIQRGWALREESFIDIRQLPVPDQPLKDDALVVFTSVNGVAFSPRIKPGHIACLEGKTLTAAHGRWPGAAIVCTADNGQALAERILETDGFKKVYFICARDHRPELPAVLTAAGIEVIEIPVYETVKTPKLIDTPFDAALFFSPGAVESFFELNRIPKGGHCFSIGQTTAKALAQHTDAGIIASKVPTQEALLTVVRLYYENNEFPA